MLGNLRFDHAKIRGILSLEQLADCGQRTADPFEEKGLWNQDFRLCFHPSGTIDLRHFVDTATLITGGDERAAAQQLVARLRAALDAFPTTIEEDELLLLTGEQGDTAAAASGRDMLRRMRLGKKRTLARFEALFLAFLDADEGQVPSSLPLFEWAAREVREATAASTLGLSEFEMPF